ncbi:MAG: hypothetical protein KC589_08580 [Nanoarchaeota archaeon]|nr:hypothetical protein [Nanoarchaeota archaeon]
MRIRDRDKFFYSTPFGFTLRNSDVKIKYFRLKYSNLLENNVSSNIFSNVLFTFYGDFHNAKDITKDIRVYYSSSTNNMFPLFLSKDGQNKQLAISNDLALTEKIQKCAVQIDFRKAYWSYILNLIQMRAKYKSDLQERIFLD